MKLSNIKALVFPAPRPQEDKSAAGGRNERPQPPPRQQGLVMHGMGKRIAALLRCGLGPDELSLRPIRQPPAQKGVDSLNASKATPKDMSQKIMRGTSFAIPAAPAVPGKTMPNQITHQSSFPVEANPAVSSMGQKDPARVSMQAAKPEKSLEQKILSRVFDTFEVLPTAVFEAKQAECASQYAKALRHHAEAVMRANGKDPAPYPPDEISRQHQQIAGKVEAVLRREGWLHPPVAGNVQWEAGHGPLLVKKGLSLQKLFLYERDIARGSFGSVSIFKNEKGQQIIGKISRGRMRDANGDVVDDLALELSAYKRIYAAKTAGPHRNLVNAYGIASVTMKSHSERVMLMDHVPGPTGHQAFEDLRHCWEAWKISSAEYHDAVQFIGRRLLDVTAHLGKVQIVHNDIKPENFLIDSTTGEPVLIDLGLFSQTGAKRTGGTRGFMSPEALSRKGVDEASDVFSVGASILDGIEGSTPQFRFGYKYVFIPRDGLKLMPNLMLDMATNRRRIAGTYTINTAYTKFSDVVVSRSLVRFPNGNPSEQAKNLDFLRDSMLDDDASREVIKKAIEIGEKERSKPANERWKPPARPPEALANIRTRFDNALKEFLNLPDLVNFAKVVNMAKPDPVMRAIFDSQLNGCLQDIITGLKTGSDTFVSAKPIHRQTAHFASGSNAGVDTHLQHEEMEMRQDVDRFRAAYLNEFVDDVKQRARDLCNHEYNALINVAIFVCNQLADLKVQSGVDIKGVPREKNDVANKNETVDHDTRLIASRFELMPAESRIALADYAAKASTLLHEASALDEYVEIKANFNLHHIQENFAVVKSVLDFEKEMVSKGVIRSPNRWRMTDDTDTSTDMRTIVQRAIDLKDDLPGQPGRQVRT